MKRQKFIPLLLIAAGLLAYHNSFTGPFIFDDVPSIQENLTIRHVWPIWQALSPPHRGGITVEGRPMINLSLAVNYAFGGYNVWGYHALNLTIHILAGLTLLGIVRRTMLQPSLRERFGAVANELALAVAILWTVHPLQTESVTYMIQRAESIMGLFYLLTLYCFIRGADSTVGTRSTASVAAQQRGPTNDVAELELSPTGSAALPSVLWFALSVTACALGMASKEVMVSAPLIVMLYDRTFLSASFKEAWRRRWPLYLALAGTWILLAYLVIFAGSLGNALTNARAGGVDRWGYLATEPTVILHYLRLTVWPHPLCLDYFGWPLARTWMSILPAALGIAILLGVTTWACKISSAWGIVGAWFILIVAPSSSFIPLDSPAFEHRMYLSLAAVVTLVVMGLYSVAGRRSMVVVVVLAIVFGFMTWRRNQDYRSEFVIWNDTVAKRPNNPRAHNNLGNVLRGRGKVSDAIGHYEHALRIKPDYAEAHNNLGVALEQAGRIEDAIGHYEEALRIKPDYAHAHSNWGVALARVGQLEEAIGQFEQALRLNPDSAETHFNLAVTLEQTGRIQDAIRHCEQALRLNPGMTEAQNRLARLQRVQ